MSPKLFVSTALIVALAQPLLAGERPNVVIIYGDDVGFADVSVQDEGLIPTPNLDRMANEGIRFIDGHCAASTCTPSRYSMLTGEMAFRKEGTGILPGNARMAINPDQYTLADLFAQAGYETGVIGKWHLGLGDGNIDWNGEVKPGPLEIGFDSSYLLPATNDRVPCVYLDNYRVVNLDPSDPITVSYGKPVPEGVPGTRYPDGKLNPEAMTYYPSSHGHNNSVIHGIGRIGYMVGGESALWDDETMSDVFVEKTKEFIARDRDRPFFLFYSSQDIHVPRAPHPRFQGATNLGKRGDAMVALDWAVGEILKSLEEAGVAENTMVIFSSDNGPVYDDGYHDGSTVKPRAGEADGGHDGSGPLRGGKYVIHEGGTRVPFFVRWPAGIEPGVSDALVSQVDFLASFADFLGEELPDGAGIDSQSIFETLVGDDTAGNEIILEQANTVAIRRGPWKYYVLKPGRRSNVSEATPHLYNLEDDLGETTNVVGQFPEIAAELDELLTKYQEQGLME